VPPAHSLPRKYLIPSPDVRPEALYDQNLSEQEREYLVKQQMLFNKTGMCEGSRYEYDLREVHENK
jgi:hypothetical protein